MEAKSMYSIGQKLFTIDDHKIKEFEVEKIYIHISEKGTSISYSDKNASGFTSYDEEYCYPNKEMLIRSLD